MLRPPSPGEAVSRAHYRLMCFTSQAIQHTLEAMASARSAPLSGLAPRELRIPLLKRVPLAREHFRDLIAWSSTPEDLFAWAGAAFRFPLDEAQLERYLAESPASARTTFAYLDLCDGRLIGQMGLSDADREQGYGFIVRGIVHPARRRRGYGTAVTIGTLRHAFEDLGLHRVEIRIFASNEAAQRFWERLGFVREGVLRHARRLGGRYKDYVVESMLEEEWRALAARVREGDPQP